jgi:hypothetical protein
MGVEHGIFFEVGRFHILKCEGEIKNSSQTDLDWHIQIISTCIL